ncbi:MAG: diaminopimelate epimerase [Clostridiales Family XIII bacterium]|jgi:diaminopimelate epimerase|nr:diaminopimelate epimerase [Clostridiales Family XIII bacterium]
MNVEFAKYHGTGNDFIIVREADLLEAFSLGGGGQADFSSLAILLCRRNTGVGADGFIVVRESPLSMLFFNGDGSTAPMCGNGIRCFAAFCYHEGIETSASFSVLTGAGPMLVKVISREPFLVEICMGKADYSLEALGISGGSDRLGEDFLGRRIVMEDGRTVPLSSLFVGTIHTVVWLGDGGDEVQTDDFATLGAEISNNAIWTEKTNVNMAKIVDRGTIDLRTYERGAGMTAACGTGASATAFLAYTEGKVDSLVRVLVPGGELFIRIEEDGNIYMQGPAVRIAKGLAYL